MDRAAGLMIPRPFPLLLTVGPPTGSRRWRCLFQAASAAADAHSRRPGSCLGRLGQRADRGCGADCRWDLMPRDERPAQRGPDALRCWPGAAARTPALILDEPLAVDAASQRPAAALATCVGRAV